MTFARVTRYRSDDTFFRANASELTFQQCVLSCAFATLLRLLSATWRTRIHGADVLHRLEKCDRNYILGFWHRDYLSLFRLFRGRPVVVVTNRSKRGDVIADICRRTDMFHFQVSDKGSKAMLRTLQSAMSRGMSLAIAVDGPLGPAGVVKRAVGHLALKLDCPIIPISVEVTKKRVVATRWDRLEIPHFFSRVSYCVKEPVEFSQAARPTSQELASRIEQQLSVGVRKID